jgi:hypothetical protein
MFWVLRTLFKESEENIKNQKQRLYFVCEWERRRDKKHERHKILYFSISLFTKQKKGVKSAKFK